MIKNRKINIIAEAGVNHNGSLKMAKEMIDVAAECGADYVKFQTFKAENLVTKSAEKAVYQKNFTNSEESQYEMIKRLEINKEDHIELISHCKKNKIQFLSTAFDLDSIDFLNDLDIPFFKIPSGEITNLPYLKRIGTYKKPVVLSTGMSNLNEIEAAIEVLFNSGLHKDLLTILHCNTEYPTPFEDVNLNAMTTIKEKFNVNVGYSDHTSGIEISIAAAALGASMIEKHFTLDRSLPGPDHLSSLEPDELKKLVSSVRNLENAFGDGIKKASKSELKNIPIVRKSIVAKKNISKGERFSEKNICVKRPGAGISPMKWDSLIGTRAKKNFNKEELIIE